MIKRLTRDTYRFSYNILVVEYKSHYLLQYIIYHPRVEITYMHIISFVYTVFLLQNNA